MAEHVKLKITNPKLVIIPITSNKILTDRELDNRLDKLASLESQIKALQKKASALKTEIADGLPEAHHSTTRYKINYWSEQHRFTYTAI